MQTYHLITYGCQMNKSDSERITTVLEKADLKKTTPKKADLIILNLCSVRQSAIDRVFGKINQTKKENKNAKIILTGCILDSDKKKFKNKVDYILDINNLSNWPFIPKTKKITNYQLLITNYLCIQPKHASKFQAYVPITNGCDNYCSYCVVPYARGKEKSRPAKQILDEVNKLIVQGYKFIILLGQNVNSYKTQGTINNKQGKNKNLNFVDLLKKIDQIPGNYWLSFITSHPKDLSQELINCFKQCNHLIPYLHLPIQSGSNKILKSMNRNYTAEKYIKLVKQVKKNKPDINLSADVIVGFPNETKKDFNETIKVMKKVKYDMAYISQYSTRAGTAAAKLIDNISKAEKKQRKKVLTEVLEKTALENNKKMVGKTVEVLIEKTSVKSHSQSRLSAVALTKEDEVAFFGLTQNFKHVKIDIPPMLPEASSPRELIGKFIKVKITKANPWSLQGKLVK